MTNQIDAKVIQSGADYALEVTQGNQKAVVPLKDCKSAEEANIIKDALLKEVNKKAVQEATLTEKQGQNLIANG